MQKLHLVMGGRVSDPRSLEFSDLSAVDLVGVFPDYASAEEAWRANAQRKSNPPSWFPGSSSADTLTP